MLDALTPFELVGVTVVIMWGEYVVYRYVKKSVLARWRTRT